MLSGKEFLRILSVIFCIAVGVGFSFICYGAAIEAQFSDGAIVFVTVLGVPVGFFIGLFLLMLLTVAIPIILLVILFSLLGAIII